MIRVRPSLRSAAANPGPDGPRLAGFRLAEFRPAGRAFTLIELLVVISILGVLAALVMAAIGRVKSVQNSRNTEVVLEKLQKSGLEQQWRAVLDQVNQDRIQKKIPGSVIAFCDNDEDRAQALWAYAHLKREFPQSFAEATSTITITAGGNTILSLPPRATFAAVNGVSSGGNAPLEAAVLLYLNLTESGRRGTSLASDDTLAGAQMDVQVGNKSFRVFKDAWGSPITFVRFAQNTELNAPPYVNPNATAGKQDPIDPMGKLANWSNTTNKGIAENGLGLKFDGLNKTPTCISAGPDRTVQGLAGWGTSDDVFAYRIRRQGNRGD